MSPSGAAPPRGPGSEPPPSEDDASRTTVPGSGRPAVDAAIARTASRFRFTVQRPVAVAMVFLAVLVFGGFSVRLLPLNLMPDISYPKLTVRTEYPGAAPAEVENNVARPLEEVLGVVTGVTRIESVSRAGYGDVLLEFAWDTDMDEANQDVLEILDQIAPTLPDGVDHPLILRYDPTLDPVLTLSLRGEGERYEGEAGLKLLRRIGDRDLRRVLEPVEGVAAVKIEGGLEEEIEVELDEGQLRRTGIGIDVITQRLQAENINLAGGTLEDGSTRYLVRTVNEFRSLDDIGDIVVVRRADRDVRLRDLARIRSGHKDREVITRVDGYEAVEVEVYKEADANIVDMADRVRDKLESETVKRLAEQYDLTIAVSSDRSRFIESSIAEVRDTAVFGGLLAVGVLFLFLRDIRSTVIVGVSIPVSIAITFAPLNIAAVSLNVMSLGGLALGVGMLVDNSIVVLESIHRCREEGDDLVQATLRGVAEVGSAVSSSTLTTIAVFFPMVFVEGVAGQMFGDLGLAVVFSLLASLAVALFLIPMLASRRWGVDGEAPEGGRAAGVARGLLRTWAGWASARDLAAWGRSLRRRPWLVVLLPYVLFRFAVHVVFELVGKLVLTIVVPVVAFKVLLVWIVGRVLGLVLRPFTWAFGLVIGAIERAYAPLIRWCLRNRALVYLLAMASMGFTVWGVMRLDNELIPAMHQGEFTAEMTLPVGTPLHATDDRIRPLEDALLEDVPHVGTLTTIVGSERDNAEATERGEHTARFRVTLDDDDPDEALRAKLGLGSGGGRARAEQIEHEALEAVRRIVGKVPDMEVKVSRPVLFSFKTPIEVEVRSSDLDALALATATVQARLEGLPELRDVKASIQPGSPEVHIVYDRDELTRRGLDIRTVAELVRDKMQGTEATKYNKADRKVPVRVRLQGADEASLAELRGLVVNPSARMTLPAAGTTAPSVVSDAAAAQKPIPLSAVATLEVGRGPNEIRRIGQQRVGVVTANVEGVGLGSAAEAIREALADTELPPGVEPVITGQSEEWETSSRSLYLALALSVFLVYVIMAAQFESLVYPLIILLAIPLAFVGVVATLLLLDLPLSVIVFLGAIMLAGIVVNNAIVLVDYVGTLKTRGYATAEALELAGRVRLRPILMTTLTTVLGLVPMAMGLGDGAEIRMPMAITVISGLSCSTLLTLLVIPTLYAGVDRLREGGVDGAGAIALETDLAQVRDDQLAPETADEAQDDD